jgi:hypothetical protein
MQELEANSEDVRKHIDACDWVWLQQPEEINGYAVLAVNKTDENLFLVEGSLKPLRMDIGEDY